MDIRNFFGKPGAAAKTKKKGSSAPPAASPTSTSPSSSSSSGGGAKAKPASKRSKAAAPAAKSKAKAKAPSAKKSPPAKKTDNNKTKASGVKKKPFIVDESESDDSDHEPEPETRKKKGPDTSRGDGKSSGKKKAPIKVDDSDSATTDDDGGLGDIIKTVSTPDRPAASNRAADSDDKTTDDEAAGAKTSKKDWEKALNYTPEKKKLSSGKKRKMDSPEKKGRRVEVSAEDFFANQNGGGKKEGKSEKKWKDEDDDGFMADADDDDDNDAAADDDEDYVEDAAAAADNKSDTDDDDFEVVARKSPRRKKSRKAAAAVKKSESDDEEAGVPASPATRTRGNRKRGAVNVDYNEDDDDDAMDGDSNEEEEAEKAKAPPAEKKATPTKKRPTAKAAKAAKSASPKKKAKKEPPVKPTETVDSYPSEDATPGCLEGLTFVFTGVMPSLHREAGEDYVKILGGRTTKAVSGKTNYLVCGDILEDGRGVSEGSKYRKAKELGEEKICILQGEGELYGLAKLMDGRAREAQGLPSKEEEEAAKVKSEDGGGDDGGRTNDDGTTAGIKTEGGSAAAASAGVKANPYANPYARKASGSAPPANPYANPYAKKAGAAAAANPYASAAKANPYAAKANPYASKGGGGGQPAAAAASGGGGVGGGRADVNDPNALWADKFAPGSSREILGNGECVRKLSTWLARWEDTFNKSSARGKSFSAPNGPWKAALLSGPPGIGKTTTAQLVAMEAGRDVLELNASDTRSKKSLSENLGDVTGSQVLSFAPTPKKNNGHGGGPAKKKRVIIMDEVDGMGAGDRSGMSELIKMIKQSQVPIICICNDRQSQKVRSLINHCLDLRYRRPVKTVIARRAVEIGRMEGMRVEQNAAEAIAESCGNDIRQVLNCLQMWSSKKQASSERSADMTYKDVKERQNFVNKDEILRVSMFDATKSIIEGPRGLSDADEKQRRDSLYKRSDAYFTDYGLMGLNVHQNYLKVMVQQFQETKRKNDTDAELKVLERMHSATESMSDFALAEHAVRGGNQNWGLLPLCSMLCVKTGHHAGGENGGFLPGFPEFAGWLGKNSSRGRKSRMMMELGHHMNYRVSADTTELRLGYVPALREGFLNLMMNKEGSKTGEVIGLMDEYGLDRDDIFEKLDEFTLDSKARTFASLDSKSKAAFTREYNKGVHKSQALVEEQGITKSKKKPASAKDAEDPDVVNEDGSGDPEDDDEDDEMDAEAIKKLFKKTGRAKAKAKPKGGKGAGSKKGKGKKK